MNFRNFVGVEAKQEGGGQMPLAAADDAPLVRQPSIYSLTFDEILTTMGSVGKDLGSMNMDEFLKNIWTAEESQAMAAAAGGVGGSSRGLQAAGAGADAAAAAAAAGFGLQRLGSLTLPRTLSQKTVDEVWRDLANATQVSAAGTGDLLQQQQQQMQPILGEMTLEEFLVRAGVVREEMAPSTALPPRPVVGNSTNSMNTNIFFGNSAGLTLGFPHPGQSSGIAGPISGSSAPNLGLTTAGTRPSSYAAPVPLCANADLSNPQGVRGGGIVSMGDASMNNPLMGGMVGGGAAGVTVCLSSPANHLTLDGLAKGNGDLSSVSPVPYVFNSGMRGRKCGGAVEKVFERRQRRMIKNRESAARSRARKQLDLRCGAKKSLAEPPKQLLSLKSCDISFTRPHQLLVGGSDAFARLYDRRMLLSLSSSQLKLKPPHVVDFLCPLHLSEHERSSLHLTHVAFSPNGEEALLSYSGEHVYLMNVDNDNDSVMKYTAADVSRYYTCLSSPFEDTRHFSASSVPSSNRINSAKYGSHRLGMYKKLIQEAAKILDDGINIYYGIEACNEVLDGKGPEIDSASRHECLCIRAALLLKRKWKNDVHMAIRDCKEARRIDNSSFMAYYHMSEALFQLGKHNEALDYADAAGNLAPLSSEAVAMVAGLKDRITTAADKAKKDSEGTARNEVRHGRLRSLNDVLLRSELSDPLESRYERDDSDYEEEMELDFVSGDEGRESESIVVRGSFNLRALRRDDSNGENDQGIGSSGSPSSSSRSIYSTFKPEASIDMKRRYVGHCNVGTDIKQASFLGQQGEFVASGSDDGRWFIWEKSTGRLVKMLAGDEAVVNCIQCHPFDCTIATSGIDHTIKMWTPHAEVPSMVAGGAAGPEIADVWSAIEMNQRKLTHNHAAVLPFELFERMRMPEFAEGTFLPFECAQN